MIDERGLPLRTLHARCKLRAVLIAIRARILAPCGAVGQPFAPTCMQLGSGASVVETLAVEVVGDRPAPRTRAACELRQGCIHEQADRRQADERSDDLQQANSQAAAQRARLLGGLHESFVA